LSDSLLAIRGLTIAFPGPSTGSGMREVVHGIDLDVERGRVLALVGESGSGKSVSAMSVLRLLGPEARIGGQVLLDGTDVLVLDAASLRAVRGGRVGMVFQEPMAAWNPVHTIGRQIREAAQAHGRTAYTVEELLASVGLDDPARIAASYPHELSGGQLQRAMIAMATSGDPELLIADEPTTALDVTVQAGILDLLRRMAADRNLAILLITHDMGVVADLADDVAVMREGAIVERGSVEAVLCSPREEYTRDLLAAVPRMPSVVEPGERGPSLVEPAERGPSVVDPGERQRARVESRSPTPDIAALVKDLHVSYGRVHALRGVDVTLRRGRTLGVVGESGSGKSTLGRALTGLVTPSTGTVSLGAADLGSLSRRRRHALLRRVGIVFQDPGSSLDPKHRVADAIAEPLKLDRWPKEKIRARVTELLASVDLEPSYAARFPHQLSGGQRQRVAIARALALNPQLLVADEPTSALDVSVQARVLELIRRLQAEHGFACLFISHDLAVVGAVSDEVAVMRDGLIVERGTTTRVMTAPEHEYTKSLLAAAPVPDPRVQRERRLGVQEAAAARS
jgi:peptide/nickel transport system ATP-binding protein